VTNDLVLLPPPEQLLLQDGAFTPNAATRIQIAATPTAETVHTARSLQSALDRELGLRLEIVPTAAPATDNAISLILTGRDEGLFPVSDFGWQSPDDLGPQGYTLRLTNNGAVIASAGGAGLFYGVQTLIQIATLTGRHWPAMTIADRPALPVRGVMLDVSRGKVPTRESLTRLVQTLAHYKINQFQLYIEHTFAFPRHPEIGAGCDPLTPDDIAALDAICHANHVQLVPCLQSLGHHRRLLSLPRYAHLAETPWRWSFATANEETFALFDELYEDFLAPFSSRWLNIGADEPWDLGRGQSASLAEQLGIGGVYLEHLRRLHALAAKHGRRAMVWADMLKHHPELLDALPDDMLLLDWWYEARPRYETLDALSAAGRPFYVCPGTSSWTALFPRLENAIANIRDYVRQGVAAGAQGMLLTDWGDGGHYQCTSHSWYPFLWGAACAWTGGKMESEAFDAAFGALFLRDGSGRLVAALRWLGATTQTDPTWLTTWNTAMALYEEPLAGRLWRSTPPETVAETRAAALALSPLLGTLADADIRRDLGFTVALIDFACQKVETTRAIRATLSELAARPEPRDTGLARLDALLDTMRELRARLPALVREFEARWFAWSRRAEIQINLDRFAALIAQFDHAIDWLEGQQAAYARGEAVDAALSSYDRKGYAVIYEDSYRWIQQLADLIGREALPPDIQTWLRDAEAALAAS